MAAMQLPRAVWVSGSVAVGVALLWGWQALPGVALLVGSSALLVAVGFLTLRVFEVLWRNVHRIESSDAMRRAGAWLLLLACISLGLVGGAILRGYRLGSARAAAEEFVPHLDAHSARSGRFPETLAQLADAPDLPRFAAPTFYEPSDDGTSFTLRLRAETGFVPDVWEYRSDTRAWARGSQR